MPSGGPGQPGHSFCAHSPHWPNAPCAWPVWLSLCDCESAHDSALVQRPYGGRPMLARCWLIASTQIWAASLPPPLAAVLVAPLFAAVAPPLVVPDVPLAPLAVDVAP